MMPHMWDKASIGLADTGLVVEEHLAAQKGVQIGHKQAWILAADLGSSETSAKVKTSAYVLEV